MALRYVRIGSMDNIHVYDDVAYDSGIETDAPIKSATPVDPTDVIRLEDLLDTSIFETLMNSIVMFEDEVVGLNNNVVFL